LGQLRIICNLEVALSQHSPDQIRKSVLVEAPRSRVWAALVDPAAFEAWFGMRPDRPFVAGARVQTTIVGTTVDADVAQAQRQFAGIVFEMVIERVEPERCFAFRWHPGGNGQIDLSHEPMTLVEFVLEDEAQGTRVTVTESGFDALPADRRQQAFSANEPGWATVVGLFARYLQR
jgi:uncharacterized protein YndB with AHSA1/START domain